MFIFSMWLGDAKFFLRVTNMLKFYKFKEMIPCSITKSLEATLNFGYVSAQGMGSHWDLISEVILFATVVVWVLFIYLWPRVS